MEIRSRIFEKYTDYKFNIPLKEEDKVIACQGEIKVGDILLERVEYPLKKSLSVPKILGCKLEECDRYILKIDGEYIQEGEVIAERVSSGKLNLTQLKSPVNGVLDLKRIKQGYIDILGQESKSEVKSDFSGYIESINPIDGLVISTDAVCVDGVVGSNSKDRFFGKLEILGDGNTILKEDMIKDDYCGKIVWVGPYLYNRVATELFERGAVAIITYAMSYTEFRETGLPVLLLGGFGPVHCDVEFLKRFLQFRDKFLILDMSENQLFILSKSEMSNKGWFVKQYLKQKVISRASSTYGYIGEVIDYDQDSGNVMVDFGKKGTSLMNIGLLDFVDL